MLVGGLATAAAVRTFPFRVFSFPKEIKPVNMPSVPEEYWREVLDSARYACGVFSVGDNFLVHPEQLEALKRLGYVRPVTLRLFRVEAPPSLGSAATYNALRYAGVDITPNPYVPNEPYLYPSLRSKWRCHGKQIIRELVPDMPDLYPLAPERARNPFAHPSRRQRT